MTYFVLRSMAAVGVVLVAYFLGRSHQADENDTEMDVVAEILRGFVRRIVELEDELELAKLQGCGMRVMLDSQGRLNSKSVSRN